MDTLKALGVDEVIAYAINDGAVMDAWAESLKIDHSDKGLITLMSDTDGDLTRELGMNIDVKGLGLPFGYERCKRFALFIDDGVIKVHTVAEKSDDPAGDQFPELVMPDHIISQIKALGAKDEV